MADSKVRLVVYEKEKQDPRPLLGLKLEATGDGIELLAYETDGTAWHICELKQDGTLELKKLIPDRLRLSTDSQGYIHTTRE